MAEYIDREAAIEALYYNADESYASVVSDFESIPAADVAPVVHGHWDENGRCTACGGHAPFWCMAYTYYKSPFCPNCGAKMDEEGKT